MKMVSKKVLLLGFVLVAVGALSACSPKVGSDAWCKAMKEKDKGDWSANEAADFLKHCVVEIKE